jgi:hypothetical protein
MGIMGKKPLFDALLPAAAAVAATPVAATAAEAAGKDEAGTGVGRAVVSSGGNGDIGSIVGT